MKNLIEILKKKLKTSSRKRQVTPKDDQNLFGKKFRLYVVAIERSKKRTLYIFL